LIFNKNYLLFQNLPTGTFKDQTFSSCSRGYKSSFWAVLFFERSFFQKTLYPSPQAFSRYYLPTGTWSDSDIPRTRCREPTED
jgi:hypothetical protein